MSLRGPVFDLMAERWGDGFEKSSVLQDFSSVLGSKRLHFRPERRLRCFVEFGRRCGPGRDGDTNFQKELFLTGRRADAQQSHRLCGRVAKLVRCVGGDVNGLARSHHHLRTAESCVELAFDYCERLFEIVSVRRGPPPGGISMSIRQKRPPVSSPVRRIV
jgi:hypothetical protein